MLVLCNNLVKFVILYNMCICSILLCYICLPLVNKAGHYSAVCLSLPIANSPRSSAVTERPRDASCH